MPPGSAIVNTTSVNAYDPSANLLDYAMTKAAIASFTTGLAKQMIRRVNGIASGPLWTPLQVGGGQTMQNVETFGQQVPTGRPGQPAEIAPIHVGLASARASERHDRADLRRVGRRGTALVRRSGGTPHRARRPSSDLYRYSR